MKTYFIGDLHGNLPALERCLRHADESRADRIICLGDLVGWLPFGDRVVARMRELDLPTVAGNHDLLVAGLFEDLPEQVERKQASAYNCGLLSTIPGALDYLASFPMQLIERDFLAIHSSPFHLPRPGTAPDIECFPYAVEVLSGPTSLDWAPVPRKVVISGHDHIPKILEFQADPGAVGPIAHKPGQSAGFTVPIRDGHYYWIKTGSVGGPYRDGIPAANSAVYDDLAQTVTLHRLEYDASGLARELADHPFARNLSTLRQYVFLLRKS